MIREVCKQAGLGFLTGQAFAGLVSLYHAYRHGPLGERTSDFVREFQRKSVSLGIQMASWSALSGSLEPFLKRVIESEFQRSVVSGATTSAVLAARKGVGQIVKWAAIGAAQSFSMSALTDAMAEIGVKEGERIRETFFADRNEFVIQPPLTALGKAYKGGL
jgi:hypothetical protein